MTQTDPNTSQPIDIVEELQLAGEQLLAKVKDLAYEGSVRHIRIKQNGQTIFEVPLALGFAGVLLSPTLAAIGAFSALLAQCTIEVVRTERPQGPVTASEEPAPLSDEPLSEL